MAHILIIKNMVCPRCIAAVRGVLAGLGHTVLDMQLGQATIAATPTESQCQAIDEALKPLGFELLRDERRQLVSRLKGLIVNSIFHSGAAKPDHLNYSDWLAQQLGADYDHLRRLFTALESKTIERYIIEQKTERVKELLMYNQLTMSEIAWQLGYSSPHHLSAQFKKETGMSPSEFRQLKDEKRRYIDSI